MDKSELRKCILNKRNSMTENELFEKSSIIFQKLNKIREYRELPVLLCYASYKNEVMTEKIIEDGINRGKRVALPRVEGRNMDFFYIKTLNDLKPGYMSIPEPVTYKKVSMKDAEQAFMVIPGTSFDRHFNRNGYGGGFYDRYIEKNPPKCIAGIAFEYQIFDEIPTEEHDKKVDYIVSEVDVYGK
ncbi:MAG: 5-formyltetrahydrofolate cyclo-ligase [Lachnospiraceae bacterium]|nr:5-formyltetrahydrofolate cyclo-ligase [Lachnospiraceae bacterium]MDE6253849.1 5-formyltetrahydrofolate cyclo-ligase [Lachnospiraceae bacterium]